MDYVLSGAPMMVRFLLVRKMATFASFRCSLILEHDVRSPRKR